MQANELRIGNWIKHLKEEETVWSTQSPDGINSMPEGWYEPILITEEWLVKFRWKKDNYELHWIENKGIELWTKRCMPKDRWVYDVSIGELFKGEHLCYIKYVHQLQNLYFALTGEELKTI